MTGNTPSLAIWGTAALAVALFFVVVRYTRKYTLDDGQIGIPSKPCLLVCSTTHRRFFPVKHDFKYPLLYAFLPLDGQSGTTVFKWWSGVFRIASDDYLGDPPCNRNLLDKLRWHLQRHVYPHKSELM